MSNDVNAQINEEMNKFYNKIYLTKSDIGLKELFKKAIMRMAMQQHKIPMTAIRDIVNTPEKKLTVFMVECICKVVLNVPLERLYKNFEDAVAQQIKFEKFVSEFNKYCEDFSKELQIKRATLHSLSGNNLRIIPQA